MWRIVDISDDNRQLSLSRGSLIVSTKGQEVGRIPLSDIQSVIIHSYGAVISINLCAALSEAGIPIVLCGQNHVPISLTLPISGNFEQASRLHAQATLSIVKQKQLWRELVRAKITAQARSLELIGHADALALSKMVGTVRSGDPGNVEARAARFYWPRLFGDDFRRDVSQIGLNSHLNYGYTVLRSAMARAVVAVGLSPGLGLHHRSRLNAFQLVDDLMEPFRPLVDHLVWTNKKTWDGEITSDAKRTLAAIINAPIPIDTGLNTVSRVMSVMSMSLARIYTDGGQKLEL
jgi:CRISP-associated protein Cas1